MALLTNPNSSINNRVIKILMNNVGITCTLLYVLGVLWFLCLAHKPFNEGTYFSENALLPGLVQGEFDGDITAKNLYLELHELIQVNSKNIFYKWLLDKFKQLSIDAFLHNFTLTYPLADNVIFSGQNVYGILRASRSSSSEALIISSPFRSLESVHPDTTASIALMLALAKFFRRHKYWAKDIIFLVTDHEQLGTQAWLEAYHNVQLGSGILNYGNIDARAGSIQAAVNLEIHSPKISHIDLKIEGLNGQLPNLDLVNLVHKLCKNEGIRHTFKNKGNPRKKDSSFQQWYHSLTTLVSMIMTQASCVPNGNHGLYHRFGIEAVTLEGYKPANNYQKQVSGFYHIGRVLEGVLRSLNNLLERFHQSYFFYFLPSNDRFIPIGSYMPSIGFMGAPLLIKGLTIWLKLYSFFKPIRAAKDGIKSSDLSSTEKFERKHSISNDSKKFRFIPVGLAFLVPHIVGWVFLKSGPWFAKVGYYLNGFSTSTSIYIGFFIFYCLSLNSSNLFTFNQIELNLINIVGLLELATLFLITAMHNFSLSLILCAIYIPCVCFISVKCNWKRKIFHTVHAILIHPFTLLHIFVVIYTYVTHDKERIFSKVVTAVQNACVYFIVDEKLYGNWLVNVIFGFLTPNWIIFWMCIHS